MEANTLNAKKLFQRDIRYIIPEFQRRYVWTRDRQWEPLWDDVIGTAERYLEELERSGNNRVRAERNTPKHFLGAIVIQQVHTPSRDIERRDVIDGQQRMTTLQILLDAVQYVFERMELKPESRRLSRYVANDKESAADEDQIFKLLPTRGDREAFRHVMHNGLATDGFEDSQIVRAHQFFQTESKEWIESETNPDAQLLRIEALETVVTSMLEMVVIDLDADEEPHVIFETLNARGTPLLESDLIKNYVMYRAERAGKDVGTIWGDLDDDWWRQEIRQGGRLVRPRIDMLFDFWLEMRTAKEVIPARVFRDFRTHSEDSEITDIMADVRRDLQNYRDFETGIKRTAFEDKIHYRNSVMNIDAMTPALLILLSLPSEKRIKPLRALESFLIRRMLFRLRPRSLALLTFRLVRRLQSGANVDAGNTIVEFLKGQTGRNVVWPKDATLVDTLETMPLYNVLSQGRLRLVLVAIEEKLRESRMPEQNQVPRNLPIEHVMPRSWQTNWPLSEPFSNGNERQEAIDNRNRLVHTIGNLTLVNRRLNSTLSNAAWENKRSALADHSVLFLNKALLDESKRSDWDEDFIQARSKRMAKLVAEIWPGPESTVWDE